MHKVTQYKKGKESTFAQGRRCYDRKQEGRQCYDRKQGGKTKPLFRNRCKRFGGQKKSHW